MKYQENTQDQCADSAAVRAQSNQNGGQTKSKTHNQRGSMSTKRTTTCTKTGSNESTPTQRRDANEKCMKTSSWEYKQRFRTPQKQRRHVARTDRVQQHKERKAPTSNKPLGHRKTQLIHKQSAFSPAVWRPAATHVQATGLCRTGRAKWSFARSSATEKQNCSPAHRVG